MLDRYNGWHFRVILLDDVDALLAANSYLLTHQIWNV